MAAAPVRPWRPPESRADESESFRQAKPTKRENSGEMPRILICLPQAVRLIRNQSPAQRARAIINEAFKGDGSSIEGRRTASGIKGVARRLSVLLLAGPLIKPSKKGMIAAEAINDVNKKSALRKILNTAERPANIAEQMKAAATAKSTAKNAGRLQFARIIALIKPPR